MTLLSLGLFVPLAALILGKGRLAPQRPLTRAALFAAEILLATLEAASLDFYYRGFFLMVLADLVYTVQDRRGRAGIIAVLTGLYAPGGLRHCLGAGAQRAAAHLSFLLHRRLPQLVRRGGKPAGIPACAALCGVPGAVVPGPEGGKHPGTAAQCPAAGKLPPAAGLCRQDRAYGRNCGSATGWPGRFTTPWAIP